MVLDCIDSKSNCVLKEADLFLFKITLAKYN